MFFFPLIKMQCVYFVENLEKMKNYNILLLIPTPQNKHSYRFAIFSNVLIVINLEIQKLHPDLS